MMPQARQNNQGIWAKNVEEPTRQYAKRIDGDIYVYTGSVGKVGSIGNNHVTVPEYLFKLIYDPSRNLAWAYWIQNTDDAPMMAPISYQDLALKTGIDFHLPASVATSSKPMHVRPERWNATRPFHGFKNYQP